MIAIKDMEMPKECYKCDFCHYDNSEGMDVCDITGNYISAIDGQKKRDDDCPLVEIPEQKTGHWKRAKDKTGHLVWECDNCGWQQRFATTCCPDCGQRNQKVR